MDERIEVLDAGIYFKRAHVILFHLLKALQDDEQMKGRLGCMLHVASPTGVPVALFTVGVIGSAQQSKCSRFAQEKALRLGLLAQYAGHRLSRQSADKDLERYPGAVLGHRLIHSTSAFPADVDEMYSAAQGIAMDDLNTGEARILVKHANSYFDRLEFLFDLTW